MATGLGLYRRRGASLEMYIVGVCLDMDICTPA